MIPEKKLVTALGLEVVVPSQDGTLPIEESDVCRPGLQLTGFWDYFAYERPQLFGKVEMAYLSTLDADTLAARLKTFFSFALPCVIVCRGLSIPEAMLVCARERRIPVYRTQENTVRLEMAIINYLNTELAPRRTMHGVLVDVYGVGMLITGNSGVGKSEAALELVKRGHRLIADDAVELRRVSDRTILGTAPENIRHFIELRGVGIINVARVFGSGAVKMSEKVDLVVELEPWDKTKNYSRTGLETDTTDIMGIQLPCTVIPVMPGRNLAVILEAAAINNRQKKMGYNAARELLARLGLDEDDPSLR